MGNSVSLPAGYEDAKPASIQLPEGYEDSRPVSAKPTATISARPSGVMSWLEDLQGDIRYGGGSTLPGRVLQKLGAPGISRGQPESVGEFMGGPAIGPVNVAHGAGAMVAPGSTGNQRVRGFNEAVRGVGQTLAPALGVAAPEVLPQVVPSVAMYGTAQQGIQSGAEALGADPDSAEAIANAATIALPFAKAGMPRAGRFMERNAVPIGKAAGYGVGAYEAAKTGNPLWLLTGSPRATKLAAKVARMGGRATAAVGEAPLLPHELIDAPAAPSLIDQVKGALPAGQYEAPASQVKPPAHLGEGVYEGEYMEEPPSPPPAIRGQLPRGQYQSPPSSLRQALLQGGEPVYPGDTPPSPSPLQTFDDTREDLSLKDAMREDEARTERAGLGEERRQFAAGSSMDKPKWLRQAEAKAAKIIQEAEENARRPARYTKTPSLKVKVTKDYPRLIEQVRAGSTDEPAMRPQLIDQIKTQAPALNKPLVEIPSDFLDPLTGPIPGSRVLNPEESLEPSLQKSLKEAMKKRGR